MRRSGPTSAGADARASLVLIARPNKSPTNGDDTEEQPSTRLCVCEAQEPWFLRQRFRPGAEPGGHKFPLTKTWMAARLAGSTAGLIGGRGIAHFREVSLAHRSELSPLRLPVGALQCGIHRHDG